MADLGKAFVQIVPSAEGISGSISAVLDPEATSAGASAGTNAGNEIGNKLKAALIGLGIGKVIGDAISSGAEFETSMAKASTLFSGTTDELKGLQDEIMGISSATGVSASQLAEAAYSAESASVPAQNLGTMIEQSSKLATAGFTDIDTALSATAKTMNAYGMVTDDVNANNEAMEKVQRILIQTQNKGITTVGELGASLANVTPTAASAGVSFEQVGASLALMTAKGTPTAQATTQVRSAIAELEKSGTKASVALEQAAEGTEYAGMSFTEMMASGADLGDVMGMLQEYADKSGVSMLDLWSSVEGGNAAMAIASDVGTFKDDLAAMATEADVVGEAYSTMADTAEFKINKFKNALQNVGIEAFATLAEPAGNVLEGILDVSERLWPSVETLGGAFTNMMGSFGDYIGDLLGLEEGFSGVDAVIAVVQPAIEGITGVFDFLGEHADIVVPILMGVVGAFTALQAASAITGIITGVAGAFALLTSPIGIAVVAITAVIAIGVTLYKNWDTIKKKAGELSSAVTQKAAALKDGFVQKVTDLKNGASQKFQEIHDGITDKIEGVKSTAISKATELKDGFVQHIQDAKDGVVQRFTDLHDGAVQKIQDLHDGVTGKIEDLKTGAVEKFQSLKDGFDEKVGAISDKAHEIFDGVKGFIEDPIGSAKDFVHDALEDIKGMFDFELKFPDIKLPHLNVSWEEVAGWFSIPRVSIDWYAKAYDQPWMFMNPTVLGRYGFGDGPGGEIVYGHENLMRDIREAVGGAGTFAPVINVYAAPGQNVNELAKLVMEKINFEYERAGKVFA